MPPTPSTTFRSAKPATHVRSDAVSGVDSSTFGEGVRLLPEPLQADIRQLYFVLRTIDDLVDENRPDALERVEAVERWAAGGEACTQEARLLADLAARYPLRRRSALEFCAGMRHDLAGATIETEADLERYCQQAGGSVGTMLGGMLGTTHPQGLDRLAALGRAMQRTNILRDIDEDRAAGRVYIARETIVVFGPPEPGRRESLLRDQIARADRLYEESLAVVPTLIQGREAMGLATALYREILRQLERDGYGLRPGRVTVPEWRKRQLVAEHRGVQRTGGSFTSTRHHIQPIESLSSPCLPV